MRRNLVVFLIFVLLLAACGGNAPPTADNSSIPTLVVLPTTDASTASPLATEVPRDFGDVTMPPAGTMSAPTTPDPEAGKVFDTLLFVRTGGLAGGTLTIQLTGGGILVRDGVTSQISAGQVTQLVTALDNINFFGLEGIFTAPGTSADAYHYELTVERDGSSRTLKAEDGFIPTQMAQLFGQITELGA